MVRPTKSIETNDLDNSVSLGNRYSIPWIVNEIWKSILTLNEKKESSTKNALISHLTSTVELEKDEVEDQIKLAVKDQLVRNCNDILEIPENNVDSGAIHDWYCIECHFGGDVIPCDKCWRVFHQNCVENSDDQKICECCQLLSKSDDSIRGVQPDIQQVNRVLTIVYEGIKEEMPSLVEGQLFDENGRSNLNKKLLFDSNVDFKLIGKKLEGQEYKRIIEFEIDIRTILHNVFVLFGPKSEYSILALKMFKTCRDEGDFVRDCVDCYFSFYENASDENWFCYPCNPPHDLVFAKVKGFSHWPAKVIKCVDDLCYVWFFGNKHERAFVKGEKILPYTAKLPDPKFAPLVKAYEEFNRHKDLLKKSGFKNLSPTWKFSLKKKTSTMDDSSDVPLISNGIPPVGRGRPRGRGRGGRGKRLNLVKNTSSTPVVVSPASSSTPSITHHCDNFEVVLTDSTNNEEPNAEQHTLPLKKRVTVQLLRRYSDVGDVCSSDDDLGVAEDSSSNNKSESNMSMPRLKRTRKQYSVIRRSSRPKSGPKRLIEESDFSGDETSQSPTIKKQRFQSLIEIKKEYIENVSNNDTENVVSNNDNDNELHEDESNDNTEKVVTEIVTTPPRPMRGRPRGRGRGRWIGRGRYANVETRQPEIVEDKPKPVVGSSVGRPPGRSRGRKPRRRGYWRGRGRGAVTQVSETAIENPVDDSHLRYSVLKLSVNESEEICSSNKCDNLKIVLKRELNFDNDEFDGEYNEEITAIETEVCNDVLSKSIANNCKNDNEIPKEVVDRAETSTENCEKLKYENIISEEKQKHEKAKKEFERQIKQLSEEIELLKSKHKRELSESKLKQWCCVCSKEAIYYCCWNTSYCSTSCQDRHWKEIHKSVCRRKQTKST